MTDDIVYCPAIEVGAAGSFSTEPVTLIGKVFEIGEYPERGFAIDEREMDQAIACFEPVPNDLEHSRLKDVLGNALGSLQRIWREGVEVFGEVTVPKWLADLSGNSVKVSLAFDRAKRVVGNALTLNPRISDAQVVAAFSVTQDVAAGKPEPRAKPDDEKPPTFKERVLSVLGIARPNAGSPPAQSFAGERNLDSFAEGIALRYAEDAVRSGKFLPADRALLATAFRAALLADSGACFSGGKLSEGECCGALRELVSDRPVLQIFSEIMSSTEATFARGDGISQQRIDELLGKSDLGREAKKAKNKRAP